MIGAKRARILPLRVCDLVSFSNRDPAIFANRDPGALINFIEPRDDARSLGPVPGGGLVVVRQRAVKRILPRRKFYRNKIASLGRIRIVEPAITFRPFVVPGTGFIRHRIVLGRFFANPENSGHDAAFPWVTLTR